MQANNPGQPSNKIPWNLAIVGGGRTCKFFLELIKAQSFPLLNINLLGVCDIDPEAQGLQMAREMGIATTDNFRDFYEIPNLDGIIELTNDRRVLLELIQQRPKTVGILEHNVSKLIRSLLTLNLQLQEAQKQVMLEKMSSDFLIQQSNAAIAILNTDFTIAEANDAYLKIVNKTKAAVIDQPCYEVYYGLKAPCSVAKPELQCPMLETLRTGKSAHVIHEMPKSRHQISYGNIVTYPMKDQNGQILRVIEIWRDITEAIADRWEKRVAELKANLNKMVQEDRMISLGKLVASCVHEINNPLQGLLTFNAIMQEMLAQETLNRGDVDQLKHFAALMENELERCGKTVSGLLSFAREAPLEYKDIDFRDVIKAVTSLTHHKMELQNVRMTSMLPQTVVSVRGDIDQLQQCVLNLIFNAIESMPAGGDLTIALAVDADGGVGRLRVADTGCGIPPEDLDHIYDPFFTTKPEGEGTGLGLSIVYGVVKHHSGTIAVRSRQGQGTEFKLELPLSGGSAESS